MGGREDAAQGNTQRGAAVLPGCKAKYPLTYFQSAHFDSALVR